MKRLNHPTTLPLTMTKAEYFRSIPSATRFSRHRRGPFWLLLLVGVWACGTCALSWAAEIGTETETVAETVAPPRRWVVVVDPGHGGKNAGVLLGRTGGSAEKDLLLQLAQAVKAELRRRAPVDVHLTRKRDEPLSISERITLANRKGTDIFISLHITGTPSDRSAQPRLFVNRMIQDPAIKKIEQKHKAAGAAVVPWDLAQNDQIKYSLRLAKYLQTAWKNAEHDGTPSDAALFTDLPVAVLSGLASPGLLLEVPPPLENLSQENMEADYFKPQAKWIARGILRFVRSR